MSEFKFIISMIAVIGMPIAGAIIGGVLYIKAKKAGILSNNYTKWPSLFVGIPAFVGMGIGALIMHFIMNS